MLRRLRRGGAPAAGWSSVAGVLGVCPRRLGAAIPPTVTADRPLLRAFCTAPPTPAAHPAAVRQLAAARQLAISRVAIKVTHSRSSGSGGQNVNKLATKVTLRVDMALTGLPADVLARLAEQQRRLLVTGGTHLLIQCEETRSQSRNLDLALRRLQQCVDAAAVVPRERVVSVEPPESVKRERRREKRQHSEKKTARRGGADF